MTERGLVHSVQVVTLGSYLAADAALAAETISVEDVSDFNQEGGNLLLNGVEYVYTSADFDTDTITLATGLVAGASVLDRVDVSPLSVEKRASVVVAGGDDALTVLVPHSLYDRLAEGIRDEPNQESVTFERFAGGPLVLTDVVGRVPVIDGSFIDPTTLPPTASDGLPPSASPTPTMIGGLGSVFLRWTPVANADPVQFKVYVDTTPGFVPGPGNLVVTTAGSSYNHRPANPDYTATYYGVVVEFDADGDAPPSGEASAQMMQVNTADVAAEYGYFGNIAVDQLTGGSLAADIALLSTIRTAEAGARVEISPFGIVIYNPAGVPETVLPSDGSGSTFKGAVEAGALTVTGRASFRSVDNEISRGAALTLAGSSTAPSAAPTALVGWNQFDVELFRGNYGLYYSSGEADFATAGDSSPPLIQRESLPDVALPLNDPRPWGGLTRIGTDWYTLGFTFEFVELPPPSGWQYVWWITRYSSTGVRLARTRYTPVDGPWGSGGSAADGLAPAAIGTDGTNVLIAEFDDANNRFRIQTRNPTTLALISTLDTSANAGFTGPVIGVARGSFDFGSTRTIILSKHGNHLWPFDAAGAYQSLEAFSAPAPGQMSGFIWDGVRFWSTNARWAQAGYVYAHSTHKWIGADSATWYTTSGWRDSDPAGTGTHDTTMGPFASFIMRKRAWVTLTSPTIPDEGGVDDPNAVTFYLSNTTPVRTSFWRQTLPADGVNSIQLGDAITFAGTNPPATNNFPGATPGLINNSDGTLAISGDGTIAAKAIILAGADNIQVFTSNGTWTKPVAPNPIPRFVRVRVVGGGGAGGGSAATTASNASAGSGGGGGGYAESLIPVSSLAASVAVTVGAGGIGGTSTGPSGGQSSFGALVVATGGTGGNVYAAATTALGGAGGPGGMGTAGQIQAGGSGGGASARLGGSAAMAGAGGASVLGGGGAAIAGANGDPGNLYGGGGGGAACTQGVITGVRNGGSGAAGVVIVESYY